MLLLDSKVSKHRGFILITVMLFLLITSLLVFASFDTATLQFRISQHQIKTQQLLTAMDNALIYSQPKQFKTSIVQINNIKLQISYEKFSVTKCMQTSDGELKVASVIRMLVRPIQYPEFLLSKFIFISTKKKCEL